MMMITIAISLFFLSRHVSSAKLTISINVISFNKIISNIFLISGNKCREYFSVGAHKLKHKKNKRPTCGIKMRLYCTTFYHRTLPVILWKKDDIYTTTNYTRRVTPKLGSCSHQCPIFQTFIPKRLLTIKD